MSTLLTGLLEPSGAGPLALSTSLMLRWKTTNRESTPSVSWSPSSSCLRPVSALYTELVEAQEDTICYLESFSKVLRGCFAFFFFFLRKCFLSCETCKHTQTSTETHSHTHYIHSITCISIALPVWSVTYTHLDPHCFTICMSRHHLFCRSSASFCFV